MQWYYARDGRPVGPIEERELFERARTGQLSPGDLVWNESMGQEWGPASAVAGLFPPQQTAIPLDTAGAPPAFARLPVGAASCTAPVSVAWARMKQILFTPFDMAKWFTIGFSAWLATLGEGGGGANPLAWMDTGKESDKFATLGGIEQMLAPVKTALREHYNVILIAGAVTAVLILALSLVLLWLRCRGKFMFLDNVVNNRACVGEPWTAFAQHARSLFWWLLAYSLVCLLVLAAVAALAVFKVVIPCVKARAFLLPSVIPLAAGLAVFLLVLGIVTAYVSRFLNDFVVPLMYRHDLTAREAWARFRPLFRAHAGLFVRYGLFYLVLTIIAGLCVVGVVLITCCLAGCLMVIPYVGAVVLLPMTTFFRLYSLEFLAQFGSDFHLPPDHP
jgi:hypothetical protein